MGREDADIVREFVSAALDEPDWLNRAILSGVSAWIADHPGQPLTNGSAVGLVKRVSGNVKGETRKRFGIDRPPRYSPYKREADGYVCHRCASQGRARCDHVIATLTRERDEARSALDATIRWARDMSERCDAFTRRAGGNVVKPNAYDELLALLTPTPPPAPNAPGGDGAPAS